VDFRNEAKNLFTSSTLEEKRVKTRQPDPREISVFKDLESIISVSFHKPVHTLASIPSSGGKSTLMSRPFERTLHDQDLLKKLIQYRNEIPLSSRIIRKKDV
jgi:hypothetical protein